MDYHALIKKISRLFLEIVFPIDCLGCGREGTWLCRPCQGKITLANQDRCPYCQAESPNGRTCPKCHPAVVLDGVLVVANYNDELLQKLIHTCKYYSIKDLAAVLAKVAASSWQKWQKANQTWPVALVPVPLHRRRQKARGFNQAELLAKHLTTSEDQVINALERVRNTGSQMSLDPLKRRQNIKGAFCLKSDHSLAGKTIIIVDDVATTLATLEECAKELRKSRPAEIWGLVLARGK